MSVFQYLKEVTHEKVTCTIFVSCFVALCLQFSFWFSLRNSQSSEDTEPGTKGKLSILYMSGPYADSARAMAEEFTEKTGYEVEVNDVPFASFHETAMLDFASQAGSYDVVAVNLSWLGSHLIWNRLIPMLRPVT